MRHPFTRRRLAAALLASVLTLTSLFIAPGEAFALGDTLRTLSAGGRHSALITSAGVLYTTGANDYGQLGDATTQDRTKFARVRLLPAHMQAVSCGANFTMSIDENHTLWAWGDNRFGQLGTKDNKNALEPVKVMESVAAVSAGNHFAALITLDGTLMTTGLNNYGQLGQPTTVVTQRNLFARVADDVVSVSAGQDYMLYVKKDGSLWAWGNNDHAQLGKRELDDKPVIASNVRAAAAGVGHSAAIMVDGSLMVWGDNAHGQLGDGTTEKRERPVSIGVQDIAMVALSATNTFAVTSDGTLLAWGARAYIDTPIDMAAPLDMNMKVSQLSVGYPEQDTTAHLMAADETGVLWVWGHSPDGQLGLKESGFMSVPRKINLTQNAKIKINAPDPVQDKIPFNTLSAVSDAKKWETQIKAVLAGLSSDDKADPALLDSLTLYGECAVAQLSAYATSSSRIKISNSNLTTAAKNAAKAKDNLAKWLSDAGITANRSLRTIVYVTYQNTKSPARDITLEIDPRVGLLDIYALCVNFHDLSLYIPMALIKEATADNKTFTVTLHEAVSARQFLYKSTEPAHTYTIQADKSTVNKMTLMLPLLTGSWQDQVILNSTTRRVAVGKVIPGMQKLAATLPENGTYQVDYLIKKPFPDMETAGAEAQQAVEALARLDIVHGTTAGTFSPRDPITRAEMAYLITTLITRQDTAAASSFTDVPPEWQPYAASAHALGYMEGTDETSFSPFGQVTKLYFISTLARLLQAQVGYRDLSSGEIQGLLQGFTDSALLYRQNEATRQKYMAYAVLAGLITREEAAQAFDPFHAVTREEAAVYIHRLFQRLW